MGLNSVSKTAGDVLSQVKRIFGDEAGVQVTDADLFNWINNGQSEIAERQRINRARISTPVVAGAAEVNLTTTPVEIISIESIHLGTVTLPNMSFEEAEEYIFQHDPANVRQGTPQLWYEYANVVTLWPIPDTDGTVTLYIIQKPASVSASGDMLTIPDKFFNALIQYVLSQAYELDEDWESAALKKQEFDNVLLGNLNEDKQSQHRVYPFITVYDEGW